MTPRRLDLKKSAQGGAVALVVVLILTFTLLLMTAVANRSLLFEQRISANQYRASQAFEAAEAGLEWALAKLNDASFIDDRCNPLRGVTEGLSFADRYLGPGDRSSGVAVRADATSGCRQSGRGWVCRCTSDAALIPGAPASTGPPAVPIAFEVKLTAGEAPGLVEITSTGCVGSDSGACLPESAVKTDARAQSRLTLGRIPALTSSPGAALTVGGALDLGDSPWQIQQADPTRPGMSLHAAGPIDAPRLTLVSAPGTPIEASSIENDTDLRDRTAASRFISLFRMDKMTWRQQPAVREIDCSSACGEALSSAIGTGIDHPMVWLANGLRITAPLTLGTPAKPVLLIVDGPVQFDAPVVIHGLMYVSSAQWQDALGAVVHGAVVMENALVGHGRTRIVYDASVLQRLNEHAGTFARVAGSWRDF